MKSKLFSNPLVLIFVGALLIRLIGVSWGLPNDLRNYSLHPDEQVNLLYARQIIPSQLHFTPGNYSYGTLYLTVLRLVSDLVLAMSGGIDAAGNISPGALSQIHLAGRLLNCFFGAGLVALTFGIGRRVLSGVGAYVAAGVVAVAPALLVHSRFQTVDMLATLLAIACVYSCVRLIEGEAPLIKWTVLAGVFAGMSAGTKYVGIVAVLALLPAVLYAKKPALFGLGLLVALGAFVITTPGCLLDNQAFVRDFTFELNHSKTGHGVVFMGTSPAWIFHIGNLSSGSSILTVLLGAVGLGLAVLKKNTWAIILGVFFLIYYVAVSGGQIKFMRYILPLIPVLALGVGYAIQRIQEMGKEKWGIALGILVVGGIDTGGLVRGGGLTAQMMTPDPRDVAGRWLRDQGDISVGLVNDPWFWSPSLQPDMGVTRMVGQRKLMELWSGWTNPKVLRYLPPNPKERIEWDARLVTELKPDFISFTSIEYAPFKRMSELKDAPEVERTYVSRFSEFKTALEANYDPVDPVHVNDPNHLDMV
ncbi:MAG: glycosyltransferase family 39 protein, partial [Armatimonadota bacterium]